jgi:hypothetical protein
MDSARILLDCLGLLTAILASAQVEDEVFMSNKRIQFIEVGVNFEPDNVVALLVGNVCLTYAEIKVMMLNNIPSLMRCRKFRMVIAREENKWIQIMKTPL